MTKDLLITRIAAIVSSIETGTPESMLYIFCDMNMDDYQTIRDILLKAGLVTIKGHFVTLTPEGKMTADKLNKAISQN